MNTWKSDHGLAGNPTIEAPCCGRLIAADMLINVSALPEDERTTKKRPLVYACDGCRERLIRTGKAKRSDVASAGGADAARVASLRARER